MLNVDEIEKIQKDVLRLLSQFNPQEKTFCNRCRVKYLSLLAYKVLCQIQEDGRVNDFELFEKDYEVFKKEMERISVLTGCQQQKP